MFHIILDMAIDSLSDGVEAVRETRTAGKEPTG